VIGGWCPKGRARGGWRHPGTLHARRNALERLSAAHEWNVRDSDAALIVTLGELPGGSRLTVDTAHSLGKPFFVGDLDLYATPEKVLDFVWTHRVRTLNVAGPRESRCRGIRAGLQPRAEGDCGADARSRVHSSPGIVSLVGSTSPSATPFKEQYSTQRRDITCGSYASGRP
jgi:hypothetical protein